MSQPAPVSPDHSPIRAALVSLGVAVCVTALKVLLGDAMGREATFAFFGLALTLAGWAGGALSTYALTLCLLPVWWYLFLLPGERAASTRGQTAMQLLGLLAEGVAVSLVFTRMERVQRGLRRAVLHTQRLHDLAAELTAARTPEEVAEVMVERAVAALGASTGSIMRLADPTSLEMIAQRGLSAAVVERFRRTPLSGGAPHALVYERKQPEWLEEPADLLRRFPRMSATETELSGAAVIVPLINGQEEVLAVAAFRFKESRRFPQRERDEVLALMAHCAQALERAQLYADEVAARRKLSDLDALTSALSMALTQQDVADVVAELGMKAAGADTCSLYVYDTESQRLQLIADRGIAPEVLEQVRVFTPESNPAGFDSLRTGVARWVETPEAYRDYAPHLSEISAKGPRAQAFWAVPLITEGHPAGMLGMGFFRPRRFPVEERAFVETFGRHCAEAMRRAQRMEAERSARNLAERLQGSLATTLRSIGDAVIATDAQGLITFMNPVAEQLTGFSAAESQGHALDEVFRIEHAHTHASVETPVARVLREGAVVGLGKHTLLVARDGRMIPIDDSGAPIRNDRGGIEGVVLVFRDVSRKKREEERLTLLTEATRTLSESLDYVATLSHVARLAVPLLADWVSVDLLSADGINPERLAVAHVDPDKVALAHALHEKYPPDPRAPVGVPAVLRSGRSELYPEISDEMLVAGARDAEHLRISRELGLYSAMVVPLVARGRTLGAMTFVSAESRVSFSAEDLRFAEDLAGRCALSLDNARLFSAEQQARSSADLANRAKDEFLATVSHELRTPLNAIMGWSKLMSSAELSGEKRDRAVETIERNAVAMAQLIEDLLDVSRIISGKMRLEPSTVQLQQVIEAAAESVRPEAGAVWV